MKPTVLLIMFFAALQFCKAHEKPRIYITDSDSWSMAGASGGSWNQNGGAFGGAIAGGARPQTAEIIKTFGDRCKGVLINDILAKSDYVVVLQHEGGKGLLRHKDKVAVFNRASGDFLYSRSTLSVGGSVEGACKAISQDWAAHKKEILAAEAHTTHESSPAAQPVEMKSTLPSKLSISSDPIGADIVIDGNFAGNTPSSIDVANGEHKISIEKSGYQPWVRKIILSGGSITLNPTLGKNP